MAADPQKAKDLLMRDSLTSQREHGVMPQTREADQFWTETLERVEQKKAAGDPPPTPTTAGPDDDPGDTRDAAEIIRDEGAELLRGGDDRLDRIFQKRQRRRTREEVLKLARWALLLAHPDWRDRAIRVYSLKSIWTPERYGGGYHAYAAAAHKLLDDSDKVFGDWRKGRVPEGLL